MKKRYLFLTWFLLLFALYFPAKDGKFVNDTFFYLNEIEATGVKGILHSYNMIFLWHMPAFIYFLLYEVFGLNWLGWHIFFTAIHALNAALLTRILIKILPTTARMAAYAGGFLFLISPFQTEVVAWGATVHYLLILTFLLTGIRALLAYYETKNRKHIAYFHLSFLMSLWCFEQAFLYPLLFGIFFQLFIYNGKGWVAYKHYLLRFLTGNLAMICLYFLCTKWVYGIWIAHYGADTHTVIDLKTMYDCSLHYTAKFLLFFRYLPESIKECYYHPYVFKAIQLLALVAFSTLTYLYYRAVFSTDKSKNALVFLAGGYLLMLVPVLNLDQSFTFEIQSDRYGYIASAFFYPCLALLAVRMLHRYLFPVFLIIFSIVSMTLLVQNNILWGKSGKVAMALLHNYPLDPDQRSLILNLPDNYRGAYMFRNGFPEGLQVLRGGNYKENIFLAAEVNILSEGNETSVMRLTDSTYYVKCDQYGKWYYHIGAGAYDYSGSFYSVDFDEWNTAYTLTIGEVSDTTYLLKCHGTDWVVIDTLMPKLIGSE